MTVKVAFFAAAKEVTGESQIELDFDDSATIVDVQQTLAQRYPELIQLMEKSTWSINHEYVAGEEKLFHGAEIGMIPPVSGG